MVGPRCIRSLSWWRWFTSWSARSKHLRVGDGLDFWRVEAVEKEKILRLYAEMILPGKAWLEFRIQQEGEQVRIIQEATFSPAVRWTVVLVCDFAVTCLCISNDVTNIVRSSKERHYSADA